MNTALATISQPNRPHQTFRVGYDMPARKLKTAAEVMANVETVRERLRSPVVPVTVPVCMPRARDVLNVATPPRKPFSAVLPFGVRGPAMVWRIIEHDAIMNEVAAKHRTSIAQMQGYNRGRDVLKARYESYFRMRNELGYSLPMIGKVMGGKDHTGIMHGILCHEAALRGEVYRRPRGSRTAKAAENG